MANPYLKSGPSHLAVAYALIGTREVPGSGNSPTILGWAKSIGTKVIGWVYTQDSIPWCGLFMAYCMKQAGIEPPYGPLRALAWKDWGTNVPAADLAPGDVLVFSREGGGHVGYFVGQDTNYYFVLGGNQGDAVSITKIAKNRCVARRRAPGQKKGSGILLAANGAVSTNEA